MIAVCHLCLRRIIGTRCHSYNWRQPLLLSSLVRCSDAFKGDQQRCYSKDVPNHYHVLELTPNATQKQVKSAYYRLSKKYHPDSGSVNEVNKLKFSQISEAYEILGNRRRRQMYDRNSHSPPVTPHARGAQPFRHSDFKPYQTKVKRPLGKIFDFDEHFKQHYGERLENRWKQRKQYEDDMRELDSERRAFGDIQQLFFITVMLVIIAAAFAPSERKVR